MRSIGIDLVPWVKRGQLRFHASRPTAYGLETHLATMYKVIDEFKPVVAVVDPISSLTSAAMASDVYAALMRLLDFLKRRKITCMCTSLTEGGTPREQTAVGASSLTDTWILLKDIELHGERTRGLYILKSRGMAHSNQVREFCFTSNGIHLADVNTGPRGSPTAAAPFAEESGVGAESVSHPEHAGRRRHQFRAKRPTGGADRRSTRGV
jgi:circadian clock protein KaiC